MEVLMSGNKMRLNEKNVVNFATCNSPVDKEGWLLKKAPDASSGHGRGFQKRYFTLKGNLLFYFDKKGDKEPLGVIIMEGCTVELVEVPDQAYTFGIHFQVCLIQTYHQLERLMLMSSMIFLSYGLLGSRFMCKRLGLHFG